MRLWWKKVKKWLVLQLNKLRTMRRVKQIPALLEPSARAMLKVYRARPWLPPDTLSAGIQNGGEALFLTHKAGREIFIGKSYDHAADELIAWLGREGALIETSTVSSMNRKERRAYGAHFKRSRRRG